MPVLSSEAKAKGAKPVSIKAAPASLGKAEQESHVRHHTAAIAAKDPKNAAIAAKHAVKSSAAIAAKSPAAKVPPANIRPADEPARRGPPPKAMPVKHEPRAAPASRGTPAYPPRVVLRPARPAGERPEERAENLNPVGVFAFNDKGRYAIAFDPDNQEWSGRMTEGPWYHFLEDTGDDSLLAKGDNIPHQNLGRVVFMAVSGHSEKNKRRARGSADIPARPLERPLDTETAPIYQGFLFHGTERRFVPSIQENGLIPGGTRGGRNDVRLFFGDLIKRQPNCMRDSADTLIAIDPSKLKGLSAIQALNGYVLVPEVVPSSAIAGIWSIEFNAWIQKPHSTLDWMCDDGGKLDLAIASEADPADPEDSVQQLYRPRARPQNIREVRVAEAPPNDVMDTEQEELTTRVANHVRDTLGDQFLGAIEEVVKELSEEEDSPIQTMMKPQSDRPMPTSRLEVPLPDVPTFRPPEHPQVPPSVTLTSEMNQDQHTLRPRYLVDQYRLKSHLVHKNAQHVVKMPFSNAAAAGIDEAFHIAQANGCFGLYTESVHQAPTICCFMRGSQANGCIIELIQHHDDVSEGSKPMWLLHGCIYRCIFGQVTEGVRRTNADITATDPTAEPQIKQHPRPISSTVDFNIGSIMQVMDIEEIVSGADIPAYEQGLSECRVAIFHINSYAFRLRFQAVVTLWTQFVSAAVSHQVDYLTGDGNLFANRSFKEQLSYDHNISILTDIVERVVNAANAESTWETRVTYQLVCSTQHKEWIKAQRGEPGDADCIVGYSFCYGKQLAIQQERAQTRNENSAAIAAGEFQAKENEILLQDKERPKMLINVDLGLASTDCDWHSPLLAMLKPRATRNWRTRGAPRKAGQVNQDTPPRRAPGEAEGFRYMPSPSQSRHHGQDEQSRHYGQDENRDKGKSKGRGKGKGKTSQSRYYEHDDRGQWYGSTSDDWYYAYNDHYDQRERSRGSNDPYGSRSSWTGRKGGYYR
eukprot:s3264_g1.t1